VGKREKQHFPMEFQMKLTEKVISNDNITEEIPFDRP
jgi:hypothetical protein